MGTPTSYYCDPSIAGNSGTGTIGDPFGDVQYALDNITRDSTNGDQINVKAGTDEVLSAQLSLSTYGTPSLGAPLILRGYTSSEGDGGIGGIDGNSNTVMGGATMTSVWLWDMHLHNSGTGDVLIPNEEVILVNCEVDNTSATGVDASSVRLTLINCHIHDCGTYGVDMVGGLVAGCYFENGASNKFTAAVRIANISSAITRNIFSLDDTSDGINFSSEGTTIENNSFLTSGTGKAIDGTTPSDIGQTRSILNNLFEGWGTAIDLTGNTSDDMVCAGNSEYDCSTGFTLTDVLAYDNETLGESPFSKSGSDTFANRVSYFEPADTGSVLTPVPDYNGARGAIQPAASASTGGVVIARRIYQHHRL